jgi:hypothetical protein
MAAKWQRPPHPGFLTFDRLTAAVSVPLDMLEIVGLRLGSPLKGTHIGGSAAT